MNKHDGKYHHPPRLAEFILKKFFPDNGKFTTIGDINEAYNYYLDEYGVFSAKLWYWAQLFNSIMPIIKHSIFLGGSMFKNHFLIAWRNILKYKVYSFINIAGLAIGMACSILIYMWVQNELSVNMYHEKIDDIYWLNTIHTYGSETEDGWGTNPAAGHALVERYPEVKEAYRHQNGTVEMMIRYNDKEFMEDIKFGDMSFFSIFSTPIVKGSIPDDYQKRQLMAIDESIAEKYFGTENPIGKSFSVNGENEFEIVAVFEAIPENSTEKFKFLATLEFLEKYYKVENYTKTWYNCSFQTFLLLQPGVDYKVFSQKIEYENQKARPESNETLYVMPYKDYYLYKFDAISKIKLFALIAIFILIIACINFMNLSTARATKRAKEVGLRKVVGARRKQMVNQFFGEAIILTLLAGIISLILVLLILPLFNKLSDSTFPSSHIFSVSILLGIAAITIFTGFVSGIYPALVLSSFEPVKVLQGAFKAGRKGIIFRNVLVTLQFSFSIFLIIVASVAASQQEHILNKNLGFEKDQIIVIELKGNLKEKPGPIKEEILKIPEVMNATLSSHSLTGIYNNGTGWEWEGRDENIVPEVTYFGVDPDFDNTFKTQMAEGRFFKDEGEQSHNIVINEAFVRIGRIENPVGVILSSDGEDFNVIGVVKDFHYKPVYRPIESLIMFCNFGWPDTRYINLEIAPENLSSAIPKIEAAISSFSPNFAFEYSFLDDDFAALYDDMKKESNLFNSFTLLAIIISCLGLFGLASYMAEQRTKEIGIRKTLGASILNVVILFSKGYTKLVFLSIILACPAAYFFTSSWLEDYPYRISLSPVYFVGAGLATLTIALLTISFVTQKAARIDPAKTLKTE